MLFDNSNIYEIVNEVYYGKNNNLKKCEKLLDEVIIDLKDANENAFFNDKYDINEDPRIHEVEILLEDTFNLKSFDLSFYIRRNKAYYAWSIPTTIPIFNKDKNEKYNVKSSNYKLNCHVDTMMLILGDFTGGELLAIILHEIGHNFDTSIFFILSNFTLNIMDILLSIVVGLTPLKKWIGKIQTFIDKFSTMIFNEFPVIRSVYITYANIIISLKEIYYTFTNIPFILKNPHIYLNALNPCNIFGYGNEKFADSFATAHGYGKELISALNKIENADGLILGDAIKECGLLAIPYDLASLFTNIALAPLTESPATPIRLKSVISKLKRDLKDPNLDPKLKKELMKQIEDVEKFINNEYISITTDENRNRCIRVLYCKLLMNFPIDPREFAQWIKPREI